MLRAGVRVNSGNSGASVVAASLTAANATPPSSVSPVTTPPFTFSSSPAANLPPRSIINMKSLTDQKRGFFSTALSLDSNEGAVSFKKSSGLTIPTHHSAASTATAPLRILKESARIRLDNDDAADSEVPPLRTAKTANNELEKAEAIRRKNLSNLTSFTPFAAPKSPSELRPIYCDRYLQTVPLFTIPLASQTKEVKTSPPPTQFLTFSLQLPYTAKVTDLPTSVELMVSSVESSGSSIVSSSSSSSHSNNKKTTTTDGGRGSSDKHRQSRGTAAPLTTLFKATLPLEILLDNDALTFDSNIQRHSIVSPTLLEGMNFGIQSISEIVVPDDGSLSLAQRLLKAVAAKAANGGAETLASDVPFSQRYVLVKWDANKNGSSSTTSAPPSSSKVAGASAEDVVCSSHQPTHSPYAILADLPGIPAEPVIESRSGCVLACATRYSAIPMKAFEDISRTIADSVGDAADTISYREQEAAGKGSIDDGDDGASPLPLRLLSKAADLCFDQYGDAYLGHGGTLNPHFYRNMRVVPQYANVIPLYMIGRPRTQSTEQGGEEEDAAKLHQPHGWTVKNTNQSTAANEVSREHATPQHAVEVAVGTTTTHSATSGTSGTEKDVNVNNDRLPAPLLPLPRLAPVDKIHWDHALIYGHPPSSSLCACFEDGCTRAVKQFETALSEEDLRIGSPAAKSNGAKEQMPIRNRKPLFFNPTHETLRKHMRKKVSPPMATIVTDSKDAAKFADDCRRLILTIENFGFGILEDPESLGSFPTLVNHETGAPAPFLYKPPTTPSTARQQQQSAGAAVNCNTLIVDYRAQQAESLITRVFGYVRNCHYGLFSTWSNGHTWKNEDLSGDAELMESVDEFNRKKGFKTNHLPSTKKKSSGNGGNSDAAPSAAGDLKVLNKAGSDPHADGAYSGVHLDLHTDNTYFLDVPRLQAFGCIFTHSKKTSGGESSLVDGARVVLEMARLCSQQPSNSSSSSPAVGTIASRKITEKYSLEQRRRFLELLCTVPIAGRFEKEGHYYNGLKPAISLSKGATVQTLIDIAKHMPLSTRADGKVNAEYIEWCRKMQHILGASRPLFDIISFNNSDRAPLNPFVSKAFQRGTSCRGGEGEEEAGKAVELLDSNNVRDYYRAYEWLHSLVHDPELAIHFTLRPGQMLFFDNQRVLHGRLEFNGPRVMCGSYVANDEYFSSLKAACNYLNKGAKEMAAKL